MKRTAPPPAGRNDPCPCGSGRKFKRCCLHRDRTVPVRGATPNADEGPDAFFTGPASDASADVFAAVRDAFEGRHFASEAEANAFAASVMQERNERPVDDFLGLTPTDMGALLGRSFGPSDRVEIASVLETEPDAPALRLFDRLREALGEEGLVGTQTGNLPRALCREIHEADLLPEIVDPYRRHRFTLSSENDFRELSALRHAAEFGGLIERQGRRFVQGERLRAAWAAGGNRAVYPLLLDAWVNHYNWASADRYEELPIVQDAWLFAVYLLQEAGPEETPAEALAERFVRAFPMALEEIDEAGPAARRERLGRVFELRALIRFAAFFGLVEGRHESEEARRFDRGVLLRPTPLVHEVVRFRVEGQRRP